MAVLTNDLVVHPHSTLYHVDLCSGSGMLGLAVKLALGGALRTVAYVERDAYAAAALVARMADAALDQAPVWDDVTSIAGPEFRECVAGLRPLVVTAGYPCQPFSLAGKRLGANDPRHLWPFIDGFVGAVQPECVFLENVPGHLGLGFGRVRRDLEGRGYRIAAGLFSALEAGASHKRERLFILALADSPHRGCRGLRRAPRSTRQPAGSHESLAAAPALADAGQPGPQGAEWRGASGAREWAEASGSVAEFRLPLFAPGPSDLDAWRRCLALDPTLEPALCRVADGLASGLDSNRLRLAGNGVVPLAAAYAFISLWVALEYGGAGDG